MRTPAVTAITFTALTLIAQPAAAQDSGVYASRASEHSVAAVGDLAAAGVLAVGGVVALPLALAGGASAVGGSASAATGEALLSGGSELIKTADDLLDRSWGAPLPVGKAVVVTAQPMPQLSAGPATRAHP